MITHECIGWVLERYENAGEVTAIVTIEFDVLAHDDEHLVDVENVSARDLGGEQVPLSVAEERAFVSWAQKHYL